MKWWNYFFIYSILGHLFETIIGFFWSGESGILYGFWTPIYGIGVVTILCLFHWLKSTKHPYFYLWISSAVVLSVFEWIGGTFLESVFDIVMWDYERIPFSLGHYVSLPVACIWGFGSLIIVKWVHPFFKKVAQKVPKWGTILFVLLFLVDLFWTIYQKVVL